MSITLPRKSTETIQDLKVTKITAPSDKYKNEYNVIVTYDNTIYTNNLNEVLFESKFFGWDMFETLLLNGIIKSKVGDIDCLTECKVVKENKILKIRLTLTLDKKPMKTIQEQFDFKLNEKIFEFDDKIAIAVTGLKNEINLPILYPQAEIRDYEVLVGSYYYLHVNNKILAINGTLTFNVISIMDTQTNNMLVWMPFIPENTPAEFQKTMLQTAQKFSIHKHGKQIELPFTNIECEFIINTLIDEKDRSQFVNYKTDFTTYINLWKYLEGQKYLKLNKDTNNKIIGFVDYKNIKLYYKLLSKLITESDININHIKLFENRLVLFTNPNRQTYKRKISIYQTLEEFLEERDQFKTYQFVDYNDEYIMVEEIVIS